MNLLPKKNNYELVLAHILIDLTKSLTGCHDVKTFKMDLKYNGIYRMIEITERKNITIPQNRPNGRSIQTRKFKNRK
ncbi:unnamed protein product [Cunninghamella blakesleeana]